jgi:hypothetical protein
MTEAEAKAECERLAVESPERHTHRWQPVKGADGDWQVAKIGLAPADEEVTGAEIRADEKPPTPDDPRTGGVRDIRPWGV